MKKIKLAVLPGDGIGQEVTRSAIPIFSALNVPTEIIFGDIGWECWKKEGNPIPTKTWELIESCDATLLGATTSKPEKEALKELPESLRLSPPQYVSPIVQLRQRLDLYANIRPCFNAKGEGEHFNFTVIRENTEGLYAGFDFYPLPDTLRHIISENPHWTQRSLSKISCTLRLQSEEGLNRLFEFAFNYAVKENFKRVTFADKPNVLRKSSAFAREIFESVAQRYPQISADIHNVDAVALWMVRRPYEFGVIVAENMFGDILSDLGAGVMGGLGFAASANIGQKGCYFEPVHGSAPRLKPNTANPGAVFLTIGLLLDYFGYRKESQLIKKALQSVVREQRCVTYDLGGTASTQAMANEIIEHCLHPRGVKKISILATGNEIIQGNTLDSNSHGMANAITENNGTIYQKLQVSDTKHEICDALKYLINKSDAVIVTGGLGPTSDDTTRYAIAEVTKKELYFDETAWLHITSRLTQFNLPIVESNRQQALFPMSADLYPNENGTAFGAHIDWHGKHIFMLPGPPRECCPMFDKYVVSTLKNEGFFSSKNTHRWLTIGLIEGEIAQQIDAIVKNPSIEISYRWCYPYLEIKISANSGVELDKLIAKITSLINPYLISDDGKNAFEKMAEILETFPSQIYVIDDITSGKFSKSISSPNIKFIETLPKNENQIIFHAKSSQALHQSKAIGGTITFECNGYSNNELKKYFHVMNLPNRGSEVIHFGEAYLAWQLCQFVKTLEVA